MSGVGYSFNSRMTPLGQFAADVGNEAIKNEPMFFNADLAFAYAEGGPITRSFIDALGSEWREQPAVFDSRVHMLMPGWYPAIPGFHHDDVPRPPIPVGQHFATAGQPDYDNPRYHAKHIVGLVNAAVAPTCFAVGKCEMPPVPEGEIVYRLWHPEVERLIESGTLEAVDTPDRTLCYFDWQTFHTGVKAVANGWRWFGRASFNTERATTCTNEFRRNCQVYLEFPMEGWW